MENSKKNTFIALDSFGPVHQKFAAIDFNFTMVFAKYQPCPLSNPDATSCIFGPNIRDYFALTYITRGSGIKTINGIDHNVHKGQLYITFPGSVTTLYTERSDYLEFFTLFFKSSTMATFLRELHFSEITPIFPCENMPELLEPFKALVNMDTERNTNSFEKMMYVCQIFNILTKYSSLSCDANSSKKPGSLMENALQYFEANYSNKISISSVANAMMLDRSHFSRMFKQYMNISPQDYLIHLRIKKACALLSDLNIPIANVASSVGYEPYTFSQTFKRVTGISPTAYRKKHGK